MPIWRVTITGISASRKEKLPEKVTVEVKPAVLKAEVEEAGAAKLVKVNYRLTTNYEPEVGKIEIEGNMYVVGVDAEKVVEKGNVKDPEVLRQIYQRIFLEPMVMAINIAKELLLPLPVRMPEVRVETARKGS